MRWFPVLILGISANLDNLGVGIAYGISRIAVPLLPNLLIAGIAFLFTMLSGVLGHLLAGVVPELVVHLVGALGLFCVGAWTIFSGLRKLRRAAQAASPAERASCKGVALPEMAGGSESSPGLREILDCPEVADVDASRSIGLGESLMLGVAVSLNCLFNGLAAPWVGAPLLVTALTTAAFSYLAIWAGVRLGHLPVTRRLGDWSGVVSGLLLCLLAWRQYF